MSTKYNLSLKIDYVMHSMIRCLNNPLVFVGLFDYGLIARTSKCSFVLFVFCR